MPWKYSLKADLKKTGLKVQFRPLNSDFGVVAQYSFEQPKRPVVHLRPDWEDVDVAHELMHMLLELVDDYLRTRHLERAFSRTFRADLPRLEARYAADLSNGTR